MYMRVRDGCLPATNGGAGATIATGQRGGVLASPSPHLPRCGVVSSAPSSRDGSRNPCDGPIVGRLDGKENMEPIVYLIAILGCGDGRSEEHTSELQSLMRISYAVFCLKKRKNTVNI